MKILYLHQYFKTPQESGGTRSYWIAQNLLKENYKVVVISAKNNLDTPVLRQEIDGISVIYLNVEYSNDMGIFKRLKAFVSFMFRSTRYAFKEKNVSLVFATSTPLTIGLPALILKWFKGTPYVFEVRDLWPEVPIQLGALKNKILIKLAILFEKTIYKNAKHIIALSPGMMKGVVKLIGKEEKVSMVPNMAKVDKFFPRDVSLEKKERLGLGVDKFNIVHFGAMGIANGLDYIIDAAIISQEKGFNDVNFVFLGEGSQEPILKRKVEANQLKNVIFLGAKPMNEVSEIVNASDISMVSFADIDILKTNSPNKLFDSLSAGKPIIVNSSGWTKEMVESNKCGFYVNPQDPNDLIEKINILKKDKKLFETFSKNSRHLAENKYDKSLLTKEIVSVISNTLV